MNSRTKVELKPKKGDPCPRCHEETITLECEVDEGRCVCCSAEMAGFGSEK